MGQYSLILTLLVSQAVYHLAHSIPTDPSQFEPQSLTNLQKPKHQSTFFPPPNPPHRILQTPLTHTYRIDFNLDDINIFTTQNPEHTQNTEIVTKMLASVNEFVSRLVIVSMPGSVVYDKSTMTHDCDGLTFDSLNVSADIHVRVLAIKDTSNVRLFEGKGCILNAGNPLKRPQIGQLLINFAILDSSVFKPAVMFGYLLKQTLRIIGFHRKTFDLNSMLMNTIISGEETMLIVSPKILAWARLYYRNQGIQGVPMENSGLSTERYSYFEKAYFNNELMNPSDEHDLRLSEATLAVLEDIGFTVNHSMVQPWNYQRGNSNIFDTLCEPLSEQHCSTKFEVLCNPDYTAVSKCSEPSEYARGCLMPIASDDICTFQVEKSGTDDVSYSLQKRALNSRCFRYQINTDASATLNAGCFQSKCTFAGIEVLINDEIYYCAYLGQKIHEESVNFDLICPDPADFCSEYVDRCPFDCSNRGVCLKENKCFCLYDTRSPLCCESDDCKNLISDEFSKYAQKYSTDSISLKKSPAEFSPPDEEENTSKILHMAYGLLITSLFARLF